MKEGWETKKLGEVCEYDKTHNTHKNLPYIGLEHIESNTGKFLGSLEPQEVKSSTFYFTEEHVLYGRLRPYLNKVLLPKFKGHCSTEIFPIKIKKNIIREFLFYWLMSETIVKKIDATWTGARMPRANMNQVLEFDFVFPPLPEQQRIVSILDKCFTAINKAKANAEQNLKNAKELFESYLQGVFENGKDWEVKKLGEVCDNGPSNISRNQLASDNGKYPIYGASGFIKNVSFYHSDKPYLSIVKDGSGVGRVTRMEAYTSVIGTLQYIYPKEGTDLNYLYYSLLTIDFKKYVEGATIPHIYFKDYKNESFLYVPLPEQQRIVSILDKCFTETQKLEGIYKKKIASLDELKKSILQKAFSGRLTMEVINV